MKLVRAAPASGLPSSPIALHKSPERWPIRCRAAKPEWHGLSWLDPRSVLTMSWNSPWPRSVFASMRCTPMVMMPSTAFAWLAVTGETVRQTRLVGSHRRHVSGLWRDFSQNNSAKACWR
jgi:hypothetical protein